ncbi:MAG: hypothetical protein EHM12_08205 [Dehalococcoidia bacterium]|nr:MAG: hypothetical protein EHM12_08205 [Dehalococcoidia bacterium]
MKDRFINIQILGIINDNNEIESVKCCLNNASEVHLKYFPYETRKLWRWNYINGVYESFLTKERITEEEIERIEDHIQKKYFQGD